jgi:hypothetical protein
MSKTRTRHDRRFTPADREKRLALIRRRSREVKKVRVTPDEDQQIQSMSDALLEDDTADLGPLS